MIPQTIGGPQVILRARTAVLGTFRPAIHFTDNQQSSMSKSTSDPKPSGVTPESPPVASAKDRSEPPRTAEKSFQELSEQSEVGLIQEFIDFLKYNKKWWLTPIIVVLLLVGMLIFLTTTGAAPFLYTFW